MAFGEIILAKKIKHSINVNVEPHDDSIEEKISTTTAVKRNKKKRKYLQILDKEPREEPIPKKKMKRALDEQIPAKPEGFMINSVPVKNNKPNKEKARRLAEREKRLVVEQTSAGGFEVEILPKQKPSQFMVTTLKYNPSLKFGTFKDKSMFNSNVQRESSAELLSRKRQQRKLPRN